MAGALAAASEPVARCGSKTIESVGRVGAVLELFTGEHPERGIAESASLLGISKSATHALFATLVEIGLLERTPQARYRLGWRLLVLSRQLVCSFEHRASFTQVMHSFASTWGDAMHMGALDRGRVVFVQRACGVHAPRLLTQAGMRHRAHISAIGKVLLAAQDHDFALALVHREGMEARTAKTVVDDAALLRELRDTRRRGYAFDREEGHPGVSCVAVPVRSADGTVVAALSVCAKSERFERYWPSYVRVLHKAVAAASGQRSESAFATSESSLLPPPLRGVMDGGGSSGGRTTNGGQQ